VGYVRYNNIGSGAGVGFRRVACSCSCAESDKGLCLWSSGAALSKNVTRKGAMKYTEVNFWRRLALSRRELV